MNAFRVTRTVISLAFITCTHFRADAEVTRVEISSRSDVLGGKPFGLAGPYERTVGKVVYTVDPTHARNKKIVDIEKAPRDGAGRVAFSADLYVLAPKDAGRG